MKRKIYSLSDLVSQTALPIGLELGGGADNFARAAPPDSDLSKMRQMSFYTGFCHDNAQAIKRGEFAQTCTLLEAKVIFLYFGKPEPCNLGTYFKDFI